MNTTNGTIIQISKNTLLFRIIASIIIPAPIYIPVIYTFFTSYYNTALLCVILIMVVFWIINIYIYYFDYTVFFDTYAKELVVKRFKHEQRFSNYEELTVRPYFIFPNYSLQFYTLVISDKKFRFKYTIEIGKITFMPDFKGRAQQVQKDIIQTIHTALEQDKK